MENNQLSLAAAHAALMFLTLAALAGLGFAWSEQGPRPTAAWLDTAAICLQTTALLYLASTAILELNISQMLRRGQSVRAALGLPSLLGHLWVLLVAAAAAWRGAESRTLLAGLDWQLATLVAVSLLAIALLVATHRSERNTPAAAVPIVSALRQLRGLGWLHLLISLMVVAAIWYMEAQPLSGQLAPRVDGSAEKRNTVRAPV